jgi:DNA-binding FadR family transcriptional regulator
MARPSLLTADPEPPSSLAAARDQGSRVAERLARELFSGAYPPGALLPREIDLAEAFGVSRASVRAGLQNLTALGIITRLAGQGTTVREYSDWNILNPLVTRWMAQHAAPNPEILRQIFEFRRTTEPFISAQAARRANARDLAAIEDGYLGMARALEAAEKGALGDADRGGRASAAFTESDVAFHAAIYRATHNLVWSQLAHILRPTIKIVIQTTNNSAAELRDSLERHRSLMECIRLRQPEAAFEAAVHVMARTGLDLGLSGDGAPEDAARLAPAWARSNLGADRPEA